jgi:hypothetical protein
MPPDLSRGGQENHLKSMPPEMRLFEKSRLPVSEIAKEKASKL